MAKIYTKTGDKGTTGLVGGARVSKSSERLETYGTVDELNSILGVVRTDLGELHGELDPILSKIQSELFNLGSHLACNNPEIAKTLPAVTETQIEFMEKTIDKWTAELAPLKNFILPGGTPSASYLHWARTVCRRAERWLVRVDDVEPLEPILVKYLNRLSDFLFVMARYANHKAKISEHIWKST